MPSIIYSMLLFHWLIHFSFETEISFSAIAEEMIDL